MTTAPPCTTCALVLTAQRGKRLSYTCGKTGEDAYTERAHPDGCGPQGRDWQPIVKPIEPAQTT